MCGGTPDIPAVPERQSARNPATDVGARMSDRDKRRRGYAATMVAPTAGAAATTNILGV